VLRDAINQSRAWIPLNDGWNVIVAGLVRTYARSRKAYRAAIHDADDEKLHTWRKQVKYSRYQLESLAGLMPPQMDKRAQRLARLGHILGQDHDLALLQAAAGRPKYLHALNAPRRSKLQADAFAMGASLYKSRPKQYAKRISGSGHPSRRSRRLTAAAS
jgi:CHAD domain-containing protein